MAIILFVTTRIPYPPWEGHQIRTYNLLKSICAVHDVHLLSFVRKDEDAAHADHLKKICSSVELIDIPVEHNRLLLANAVIKSILFETPFVVQKYFSPQMDRAVRGYISRLSPDLIQFNMLPLAQYIPLCVGRPVLLDEHNVESLLLQRRAEGSHSPAQKYFFSNQSGKLYRFEEWACRAAEWVLSCSGNDGKILEEMSGNRQITVVANGVDVDYFTPQEVPDFERCNIVFVGGMGWFPNRDGMDFFIREVMPLVCADVPDATLTIVGKSNGLKIPAQLANKVRLTGFVDDFRPWVQRAGVYVIPLRVGSGTRLKLLEAMAMAKPIVSTTIGCEGVAVEHNNQLLVADRPDEMAAAIVGLMQDAEHASRLGQRALRRAVERYDWKVLGDRLLEVYQTALQQESQEPVRE